MTVDMWVGVAMFGAAMFGLGLLAGWSLLFGTTIWAGKDAELPPASTPDPMVRTRTVGLPPADPRIVGTEYSGPKDW